MYNFLVTAMEGAWDNQSYGIDKSRFLEYTTESIAELFKPINSNAIDALMSYPCIFAYEGYAQDMRIGKLTSIKDRGRRLFIEFEFYQNIPPIPFADIEKIAHLLDIRDWEINRTHWAIKDENLFERLVSAGLLSEEQIQGSKRQGKLPAKKSNQPKVSSVQGFIAKVLSFEIDSGHEVFYRGHSNKTKYKLEPSLFRKDDDGNYLHLENEHILYRELLVSNSADFQYDEYTLDKLVRMQHYSLPTRLLDITSNPLIALYFACKSASDEDGEVIVLSMPRRVIKYFDSDVASCIANLARLPKSEKDRIDFDAGHFNNQTAVKRLIHFIKEEKPYFEPEIIPDDLRKIVCVKSKKSNDRISSQSGAFLLYGLDAVMDEEGTADISVNRISVSNKEKILKVWDENKVSS